MRKPFRLLIAVPCTDYMHADFVKSLVNMTSHLQREGIAHEVVLHVGTLVYLGRDSLCCKAMNDGFTHILFIDSDMVFHETAVEDLAFCGKDFVCGAFQSRRPPYGSCIFTSLKPAERVEKDGYGTKPFRVAGCGMAFTMISSEILRNVKNKFGTCFTPTKEFGEDLAFCWRANETGAEIWCEPTARIGHIAHVPVYPGEEPPR